MNKFESCFAITDIFIFHIKLLVVVILPMVNLNSEIT